MSRAFEVWYRLNYSHPLTDYMRHISEMLGTACLPAYVLLSEPTRRADSAVILANAYRRHEKPIFQLDRVAKVTRQHHARIIQFQLQSSVDKNRIWTINVAQGDRDFCKIDVGTVMAHQHIFDIPILPTDYRVVVMDCRAKDPAQWCEVC